MNTSYLIAILSYERPLVLDAFLHSLVPYVEAECLKVFDDCSLADIQASLPENVAFSRSAERLGVAGNSNRALQWFMQSKRDFLFLCNDDLLATGDFISRYLAVSQRSGFNLLCLAPHPPIIEQDIYYPNQVYGGMLVLTRKLVERIGYFDLRFGRYGNEHVDFSNRAALAGLTPGDLNLGRGAAVTNPQIQYQEADCSLSNYEKESCQSHADRALAQVNYGLHGLYRRCFFKVEALQANRYLEAGILTPTISGYQHAC